jgi:predicted ATP-dependent endonuclease of OLD family
MIKSLRLENWKSFSEAIQYIDPVTILIGTNASGKSNLLDALELLRRIGSGADVDDAVNGSGVLSGLRGGASSICRQPSQWLALEVIIGDPHDVDRDCRYRIKLAKPRRPTPSACRAADSSSCRAVGLA